MEATVEINGTVVEWLSSMGYPVTGMPEALLRGMFLREARQWQLSPTSLAAIIHEGERKPDFGNYGQRFATPETRPFQSTNSYMGLHG